MIIKIEKPADSFFIEKNFAKNHSAATFATLRGISSIGRALAWHARGNRFDPGILHKL